MGLRITLPNDMQTMRAKLIEVQQHLTTRTYQIYLEDKGEPHPRNHRHTAQAHQDCGKPPTTREIATVVREGCGFHLQTN